MLRFLRQTFLFLIGALCLVNAIPQYIPEIPAQPNYVDVRYQKADMIHKYMNLSVNPCDDFYAFACGAWSNHHPAHDQLIRSTAINNRNAEAMRELLYVFNSGSSSDTVADRKVKDFYNSCLYLPSMNPTVHGNKLREIIQEFGEMPILEGPSWKGMRLRWSETIANIFNKYGIEILLTHKVDFLKRVVITYPEFILGEPIKYEQPYIQNFHSDYLNSITHTFVNLLGVNYQAANRVALDILEFETMLAKAANQKSNDIITSVDRMNEKYDHKLPIRQFLQTTRGRVPKDEIIESNSAYMAQLVNAIKSTPEHILANYIFYRLIEPFALQVPNAENKREEVCLEMTKKHFLDVVENLIYRQYDVNQTQQGLTNLFYDLKNIYKSNFKAGKYFWIIGWAKNKVEEMLNNMQIIFQTHNGEDLSLRYSSMNVNRTDYVENLKSILHVEALRKLNPREQDKVKKYVSDIMYEPDSSNIYVSATMLKPNYFWSPAYPKAVNFGALGFLLAREMAKPFGEHFSILIDKDSREIYNEHVQCLKDQFHSYYYMGRPFNYTKTLDENTADISGLSLIYNVYTSWLYNPYKPVDSSGDKLPPLNYGPEQLFFISFAQNWCEDNVSNFPSMDDVPGSIRVRSTLMNLRKFSTAFACPTGSAMNPQKICEFY